MTVHCVMVCVPKGTKTTPYSHKNEIVMWQGQRGRYYSFPPSLPSPSSLPNSRTGTCPTGASRGVFEQIRCGMARYRPLSHANPLSSGLQGVSLCGCLARDQGRARKQAGRCLANGPAPLNRHPRPNPKFTKRGTWPLAMCHRYPARSVRGFGLMERSDVQWSCVKWLLRRSVNFGLSIAKLFE